MKKGFSREQLQELCKNLAASQWPPKPATVALTSRQLSQARNTNNTHGGSTKVEEVIFGQANQLQRLLTASFDQSGFSCNSVSHKVAPSEIRET